MAGGVMLTLGGVRAGLALHYPRAIVRGAVAALQSQGRLPRGDPNHSTPARVSLHDALVTVLATAFAAEGEALPATRAMTARDWRCVGLDQEHKLAGGYALEGLHDVRAIVCLQCEIIAGKPTGWSVSRNALEGGGLLFAQAGAIDPPRAKTWVQVPRSLLEEIAERHEAVASVKANAELLLARIAQHIRLVVKLAEAAE